MNNWIDADVLCPFYIRADAIRVKCEGLKNDNKIHLVFKSSERRKKYMQSCCCSNYKQCRIYKILEEKYDI